MTKTRHKATIDAFKQYAKDNDRINLEINLKSAIEALGEQDSEVPAMTKEESLCAEFYGEVMGVLRKDPGQSLIASEETYARYARAGQALVVAFDECKPGDLYGINRTEPPVRLSGQRTEQAESRANKLGDECGAMRTENDALLRENAVLRRQIERLERKKT